MLINSYAFGGAGGGGGGFVPTDIAGTYFWLKADQITGLSDGDPIGGTGNVWEDQSGNANNGTRGTTAEQPVYKTNILNSMPIVRFDGSDDSMSVGITNRPGANDWCMWGVVSNRGTGTIRQNFLYIGGAASNGYGMAVRANAGMKGGLLGAVAWLDGDEAEEIGFEVYVMQRRSGTIRLWVDGGAPVLTSTATPNAPSGSVSVLGWDGSNNRADVDIAEIGTHDGATTLANANALGGYLADRWGLTWTTATDS